MKLKPGDLVSNWRIIDRLGGPSGNGDVWEVENTNDLGLKGALKVLKKRHRNNEVRVGRFQDEILAMQACQDIPGVLGLLECQQAGEHDHFQPWFVSELAEPLVHALGTDYSLSDVVSACCSFANTLSKMHQRGYSHRDIKPDNLFFVDGKGWLIGDFGLVDFPDKHAMTETSEKVGPLYYIAPEMLQVLLNDEGKYVDRDGRMADVWSLAKLIWKLGTKQLYPIEGTFRTDVSSLRLSTYVEGRELSQLDRLLEQATQIEPTHRVSMDQLKSELQTWLDNSPPLLAPTSAESQGLRERIAALYEPIQTIRSKRENKQIRLREKIKVADDLVSSVDLSPIDKKLLDTGFCKQMHHITQKTNLNLLLDASTNAGFPKDDDSSFRVGKASYAYPPMSSHNVLTSYLYGVSLHQSLDNDLTTACVIYAANHFWCGKRSPQGTKYTTDILWSSQKQFLVGGPNAENFAGDVVVELINNFESTLEMFLNIIKEYDQPRTSD